MPIKYVEPVWEDSRKDLPPQSILFRYMMRALRFLDIEITDLKILNEQEVRVYARSDDKSYLKYYQYEAGICEGLSQVASCVIGRGLCTDWLVFLDVCKNLGSLDPDISKFNKKHTDIFTKYAKIILQCQYGINLTEEQADSELDRIILLQRVSFSYDYKLVDTNFIPILREVREHGKHYEKAKALAFLLNDIDLPKTNLFFGQAQHRNGDKPEHIRIKNNSETISEFAHRFEICPYLFTPPNRVAFQTREHSTAIMALPEVSAQGDLNYKWVIITPNYGGTIITGSELVKSSGYGVFRLFSGVKNYLLPSTCKTHVDPWVQGGIRVFSTAHEALSALFAEHEFDAGVSTYLVNLGGVVRSGE